MDGHSNQFEKTGAWSNGSRSVFTPQVLFLLAVFQVSFTVVLAEETDEQSAATEYTYDGVVYKLDTATMAAEAIRYDHSDKGWDLVIPAYVPYLGSSFTVTVIGQAFDDCDELRTVSIPETVTHIGYDAFYDCDNLISVTFAKNIHLNTIGDSAFEACENLASITIPASVKTLDFEAFYECYSLSSVTFEDNSQLQTIGVSAFEDCRVLKSIVIPKGVTVISYEAFYKCYVLGSVTFEDDSKLELIGDSAFEDCRALRAINIPEGVTTIQYEAFYGCNALACVTIPTTLKTLERCAFEDCKALNTVYWNQRFGIDFGSEAWDDARENAIFIQTSQGAVTGPAMTSGDSTTYTIDFTVYQGPWQHSTADFLYGLYGISGEFPIGSQCACGGKFILGVGWRNMYEHNVYFNANGGSGTMDKELFYETESKQLTSNAFEQPKGKIFAGWGTTPDATTPAYSDGQVINFTEKRDSTLSLYAIWKTGRIVSVGVNEDEWGYVTVSPQVTGDIIVEPDTPIYVSANTIMLGTGKYTITASQNTSDQYVFTFLSWSGVPESGVITEDLNIKAVFGQTVNEIKFEVNESAYGSVTRTSMQNVPYGSEVVISGNNLTINGTKITAQPSARTPQYTYNFENWTGISDDHLVTGPITITANFTQIPNTYKVSFVVNEPGWGELGRETVIMFYGDKLTVNGNKITAYEGIDVVAYPSDKTAQYTYAFVEWKDLPADLKIVGDTKITAVFSRTVNTYTVTFDSQGGSAVSSQTVEYGSAVTAPANPTKDSKEFKGWFYDGAVWDFTTPIVGDILLVAHWDGEYRVTFDMQGHGTQVPFQEFSQAGSKVTEPTAPTAEGYTFGGWYKESACSDDWDFGTDTVQDSMTLYAKWTVTECRISSDKTNWTNYATLEEGLAQCSDGWYLELLASSQRSSVEIDKSITVIFNGKKFYTSSTVITVSANVVFQDMIPMLLSVKFSNGGTLTTGQDFPLTASFDDPYAAIGKVFVKGVSVNNISVAHGGYTVKAAADGIMLVRVIDSPYAVFNGGQFVFYATMEEALNACTDGRIFILNYIPTYDGGVQVRTYQTFTSIDKNITLATVTRVSDGYHSSFYLGKEEIYNNGQSVRIPLGKIMYAEIGGSIDVAGGKVLTISDVGVAQTIMLGGGKTNLLGEDSVATVRLGEKVPAIKLTIGFKNIDKWTERTSTPEGYVYALRDGCDYVFITSDKVSLNGMVSVKAPGFKANISPGGFSANLVASQSMVAYVKTGEFSYTGFQTIEEAIAAATMPGQYDNTVYLLYRTTDREGDQPTLVHILDSDLVFDGTFKLATVHQHVDSTGTSSTYGIDGTVALLKFTEGHGIRINSDADLSGVYIDGIINIQGNNTVDFGNNWDGMTVSLDLYAHDLGVIVKNAGDIEWTVISYPDQGYAVSKQGNDLVLIEAGSESPAFFNGAALAAAAVAVVVGLFCAVTAAQVIQRRF